MSGISNNSNPVLKSLEIESTTVNPKQNKANFVHIKDLLVENLDSKDSLNIKAKTLPSAIQSISLESNIACGVETDIGASTASVKSIKNQANVESAWVGNIQSNKNKTGNGETAIIVPKGIDYNKPINVVYFFHGWGGNISSSVDGAGKQMIDYAKNNNSILVIPKGPQKDVNDGNSWLQGKGKFEDFNKDVLAKISTRLPENAKISSIELTGHSAGGLAVKNCLQGSSNNFDGGRWSNINISKVGFIDASYGTRAKDSYDSLQKLNPNAKFNSIFLQNTDTASDAISIEKKPNVSTVKINTAVEKIDHMHTINRFFDQSYNKK